MTAPTLEGLAARGVLSPLDVCFAKAMAELGGEPRAEVLLAAALASSAVGRGHVCLDLPRLRAAPLVDREGTAVTGVTLPRHEAWRAAIASSALVSDGSRATPLVLDGGGRLYLYRYYDYQRRLAAELVARARGEVEVDAGVLRDGLARLFAASDAADEQRLAAVLAVVRRLLVISGGPGTGKTTTVAKILVLLQEQALAQRGRPLRLALLAPTGKAAGRLTESLAARLAELPARPAIKEAAFAEAATIHRALGYRPQSPTRYRHDKDNPIAADVVLVDEASMVDLALMTKLVEAVRSDAHLVLLGDKDQLASVEAGAILGDIWGPGGGRAYSARLLARLRELTGADVAMEEASRATRIGDSLALLSKSYRYDAASGIAALARAINDGDGDRAMAVLAGEGAMPYGEVALGELLEQRPLAGALGAAVLEGFGPMLRERDPERRLALASFFRILCAHRRGPLGVDMLNRLVEQHLERAGALSFDGPFYDGRPILVTQNDYQLGLFNGDVGVVCDVAGQRRVMFPSPDGGARAIHPARLPPHETVFAMTVHKSQGSELDRVAILLPERISPIVTRELLYTAVSRGRQRVDVFGSERVLRQAIARRIERASGLASLLWADIEAGTR